MSNTNPKLRKNGGKGTFVGNLLRGIVSVGKTVSPQFKAVMDAVQGPEDFDSVIEQLKNEQFTENELKFLMAELDKDKTELQEITKRWEADMKSESWMAKNVRPWTLVLYNVAIIIFIACDSYAPFDFEVKSQWLNLLISNAGIVNTAYFGSRYLEKRDSKKYR